MKTLLEVTQACELRVGDYVLIENGTISVLKRQHLGSPTTEEMVASEPKRQRRRRMKKKVAAATGDGKFDVDNKDQRRTKIFEAIHANPGRGANDIIKELGLDEPKLRARVYWDLKAMLNEQLIKEDRDGSRATYYPRRP